MVSLFLIKNCLFFCHEIAPFFFFCGPVTSILTLCLIFFFLILFIESLLDRSLHIFHPFDFALIVRSPSTLSLFSTLVSSPDHLRNFADPVTRVIKVTIINQNEERRERDKILQRVQSSLLQDEKRRPKLE